MCCRTIVSMIFKAAPLWLTRFVRLVTSGELMRGQVARIKGMVKVSEGRHFLSSSLSDPPLKPTE